MFRLQSPLYVDFDVAAVDGGAFFDYHTIC
jgi:hypothetical protein